MSQLSLEEEEGRDHHTHQNHTPQGEIHADEEPDIETTDVNKDTGTDKCFIILSKKQNYKFSLRNFSIITKYNFICNS